MRAVRSGTVRAAVGRVRSRQHAALRTRAPSRRVAAAAPAPYLRSMNGSKNDIDPASDLLEEDEEQALPEPEQDFDLAATGPLAVGRAVIASHAKLAPSSPGVYRMIDAKGDVLYVGKAKNIRKRIIAYGRPTGYDPRIERMMPASAPLQLVSTATPP